MSTDKRTTDGGMRDYFDAVSADLMRDLEGPVTVSTPTVRTTRDRLLAVVVDSDAVKTGWALHLTDRLLPLVEELARMGVPPARTAPDDHTPTNGAKA